MSDPSPALRTALRELITKWRDAAVVAEQRKEEAANVGHASGEDINRAKMLMLRKNADDLAALLDAAPPSPNEWQPIEMAPKDGRCFLSGSVRGDRLRFACYVYIEDESRSGYVLTDDDDGTEIRGATHWMPLPAAPPSREQQEDKR